jgi:BirA family transcriptional regulator, biotin operon repressor / biotin---[acetyl-CoA-carboxylase] ligase
LETLSVNTLFTGKVLIHLPITDSTNNYANNLLNKNHATLEGTVILADNQTAGKGYAGNTWDAQPGHNILMSLIYFPHFIQPQFQFNLNIAVSLGIFDTLKPLTGEGLTIKWPNDIYFQTKKIGGLLIENSLRGNTIQSSIIGIGLNVNQVVFPEGINASSLSLITGNTFDLLKLTAQLCEHIEAYYLSFKNSKINELKKKYESRLLALHQSQQFKKGNETFRAIINGITAEGKLILQADGETKEFGFKEVEFVF